MTPAASLPPTDTSDSLPVARLDAQDEAFILPLREYLATHGCAVYVNSPVPVSPHYHVVAGDRVFVKEIAETFEEKHGKRLLIIMSGTTAEGATFAEYGKVVLIDPVTVTMSQVKELFSFFFVGRDRILDWRRDPVESDARSVNAEERIASHEEDRRKSIIHNSLFKQDEGGVETREKTEDLLSTRTHVDDAARIGSIIADVFETERQKDKKIRRSVSWEKTFRIWAQAASICVVLISIPFLAYGANMALGAGALYYGAKFLKRGNTIAASRSVSVAKQGFGNAAVVLRIVGEPAYFVGLMPLIRGGERLTTLGATLTIVEEKSLEVAQTGQTLAASLFASGQGRQGSVPVSALNQLRTMITSLHTQISLAEADLRSLAVSGAFPFSVRPLGQKGREGLAQLSQIRSSLDTLSRLLTMYPHMAGFDKERKYLVLLQNSMEVRPTGGFIGSIGIATFADGALTDFAIRDVYDVDGQLRGHVDPPHPIANLLSQEHWYLRDSNMSPDFRESGERAAWFYEKETGETVDGVIGISLPFVVDLLRATGPISLSDYNDRITADNFYGKSLYYTKSQFFPGSTQKRDFLGSLARTLVMNVTSAEAGESFALFRAVSAALGRHDIIFYFPEDSLEQLVTQYGWGQVVPGYEGCSVGISCLFSPLFFAEANLSVNKASYFVKRTMTRDITIEPDGTVGERIVLTFRNCESAEGGGTDSALSGVGEQYRLYMTAVMPPKISVTDVLLNGTSIPRRTGTDLQEKISPPYVEKAPEVSGQFTLGIAVDVEPSSESRVEILIRHSEPLSFVGGKAAFEVFAQKQPGLQTIMATTTIHYPAYWLATGEVTRRGDAAADRAGIVAKDGQFEYNTLMTHDILVRLQFQQ